MTDILYNIDLTIFYFINHTISNSLFDKFFVYITNVKHWYLVYLIFLGILIFKGGKRGKIAALGAILVIALSDQLSSQFLKHLFERVRPCIALEDVRLLVGKKSSFSFPSSHAVNNFAIATFFSILYKQYRWILFTIAFLVAFSRPYIGVHYPSDIFVGALLGIGVGYLIARLALFVENKIEKKNNVEV